MLSIKSIPFATEQFRNFSSLCHTSAKQHHTLPMPFFTSLRPSATSHRSALPLLLKTVLVYAFVTPSLTSPHHSVPLQINSPLRTSIALRHVAERINAYAILRNALAKLFYTIPSLCNSLPSPHNSPRRRTFPLQFFPNESAFSAVSPLSESIITTVIKPFFDKFFIVFVQTNHVKLNCCTCSNHF